jgi:regulator of PEP synthase PpsR (kinase-PPPase family)
MHELCGRDGLHCCDLLGQPIDEVAAVSGRAARMESGRRPPLDSQYFKRMEAIEFAVKYDDGIGAGLDDADVVLVGVSRTSKTPLSMYLGYLGYKVANVPVVRGIEPPRELFEIDRAKIVGLTIDAERLSEIRQVRARLMRLSKSAYSELVEIYEELEQAASLHRRLGCPVVDVSELSIEETAQRVLRLVERRTAEAHTTA